MRYIIYMISLSYFFFYSCNQTTSTDDKIESKIDSIVIHTYYGSMTFVLFNETPLHKQNFLDKIDTKFYDSLLFHRVQPQFMIQGGDPTSRGEVGPAMVLGEGGQSQYIDAEIDPKFIMCKGALVAFHDGVKKNPSKRSNSSQFMILHGQALKEMHFLPANNDRSYTEEQIKLYLLRGGCPQLDGQYTIFGQLVDGWHILDKIALSPTYRSVDPYLPDRPTRDIRMSIHHLN